MFTSSYCGPIDLFKIKYLPVLLIIFFQSFKVDNFPILLYRAAILNPSEFGNLLQATVGPHLAALPIALCVGLLILRAVCIPCSIHTQQCITCA